MAVPTEPDPLAPRLDLLLRRLAGDVEDGPALPSEQVRDLEEQRALADPGLAADEDHRAGDDAAPEHAAELPDSRGNARRVRGVHEVVRLGLRARLREGGGGAALGRRGGDLLPLLD